MPARLISFARTRFPPAVYVTYGVLWALGVEGSTVLPSGHWSPSLNTVIRVGSVVLALLFLRMADELKDLDYDRTHHPDRPLVTGLVTPNDLRCAMLVLALLLVAANTLVSLTSVILILTDLGYGLLLMLRPYGSLAITHPVHMLLTVYVYGSVISTTAIRPDFRVIPLVLLFSFVFLHFEFTRKMELYSLSAVVVSAFGAALLNLALFPPMEYGWVTLLPCATLVFPCAGAWLFLSGRTKSWPLPMAVWFVAAFSNSLVVQAATVLR